jgi:hypothetical protein
MLQSQIARTLDNWEYFILASLDLSSKINLVKKDLLLKRLKIVSLPDDLIRFIEVWLNDGLLYVSIDWKKSVLFNLLLGTVQVGPVLYAIFVFSIFDIEQLFSYSDDMHIPRWNKSLQQFISDIVKSVVANTKWLKNSEMKLNQVCLFHEQDVATINDCQLIMQTWLQM